MTKCRPKLLGPAGRYAITKPVMRAFVA